MDNLESQNLQKSDLIRIIKDQPEVKELLEALKHCQAFDTSAKFGYEYGQEVRGNIPEPGTRFKTPKERAEEALKAWGEFVGDKALRGADEK